MNKQEKETLRLLNKFNFRPRKYSLEEIRETTKTRLDLRAGRYPPDIGSGWGQ